MCDNIAGGESFRDQITMAVQNCKVLFRPVPAALGPASSPALSPKVFLALINPQWAESEECKSEFQMAERLYNTERCPTILPVGLTDLNFKTYPHVFRLSTSTNFRMRREGSTDAELASEIVHDICSLLDVPNDGPRVGRKVKEVNACGWMGNEGGGSCCPQN